MSNATIIFLLTLCIMILICIIVHQQFVFHNGTKAKIHEISSKLKELLDTDSDEKVTVFTDNKALIELATQINRMLEDRQKVKVEYRRAEMASKKMLSNISHDIKTPMFLRADQAHIYIDIVDRGRGIEKEFADSVFDRLFMMEDSRNSAMQGNGLGLTIAKTLALQLGGDITLESHPHQKTVFTITLKKMAY